MPTGEAQPVSGEPVAPAANGRRVCLLTGAAGTLGDAFCRGYAERYDIVDVCRQRRPRVASQFEEFVDPLDVAAVLPENDAWVYVVEADLEQEREIDRVLDIALARFGRVDLLVNNAASSNWHRRMTSSSSSRPCGVEAPDLGFTSERVRSHDGVPPRAVGSA